MDSSPEQTFDTVYSSTDCYYGLDVRAEFSDYFGQRDISGLAALDLGCGEGRYSLYLASQGCHVTAVDCSRAGLSKLEKMAAEKHLPIVTCKRDVADFEFPAAAFDIIVCATILDHLERDLRRRTIRAVKSALKPGGVLYANVFTVSD
ncbi:MAG: class I SAM-dependent methyltransferase, partial [Thermodesulfobacteriota bacterium]